MAISTQGPGNNDIDDKLVVNGQIDVRKTHPNLYRMVMTLAVVCLLLGLNFLVLQPTFLIFDMPNVLWGAIFLALGGTKIVFLNVLRRLKLVRIAMAAAVAYFLFLGFGTTQPFVEGEGSLQLPIMYFALALLYLPLLLEPFINPWTASREERKP